MAPDLDLIVGYADDYIGWAEQEKNNSDRRSWFDRACHMFSTAAEYMRRSLESPEIDRSDLVNIICDKAALLTENGEYEHAKQDLLQAVQLDPHNPETRADLGFVNIELGNHKKARKNLEMAVSLEGWEELPESKKAYVFSNLAHLALGDGPEKVLDLVNRSEEYDIDDPMIISSRAHALNKIKMCRDAMQRLDTAIGSGLEDRAPSSDIASLYHIRSVSRFNLEGPDKAVEDLRTALKYDHENTSIRGDLGLLLFGMQHYEDAGKELKLCIEQEKGEGVQEETAELYARLSEALRLQGRYAEARDALIDAKGQEAGSHIEGINYVLGELELKLGNARKAAEHIAEDAGREDYQNITDREASALIVIMARSHITLGDDGFALECYTKAYELDKKNAATLVERSLVYSRSQDYKNAERDLVAALELDREITYRTIGEADYHFELGIAKAFQGKTAEGEKEISYALGIEGESALDEDLLPKAYGELGYIQLENKNIFGAQESFERSLEYMPSIRSYAGWANARYLQGDQVDAEKGFRLALEMFEELEEKTMHDWVDAIEIETVYNELSCREEYPVREQAAYAGIIVQDETEEIMPEKRILH